MPRLIAATVVILAIATSGCSKPSVQSLRDSFAQQVKANGFVTEFSSSDDELNFTGPGVDGAEPSRWRVHTDTAVIEDNKDDAQPYKGTVTSSWYGDGKRIEPRGSESNLPLELISNGIGQICWAFWEKAEKRWSWE